MRRRVAFIDYFATHYRRRLYEELARRMEMDFYFYADERERYWNRKIPLVDAGDFRRVELRRYRVAGQAVMPGVALALGGRRGYDAVVKSLNGKVMLPLVYLTSRANDVPFVLWTGMWYHPRTTVHRVSRPLTEHIYRDAGAIVAYGEHVKRYVTAVRGVEAEKVYVAGQAVDPERFEAVEPVRPADAVLFIGQYEERKGLASLLDAFAARPQLTARLRLVGSGSMEGELHRLAAGDPRIEVVGYVPQERLPSELARSRCLVLPSITTDLDREPWGLVVNEAMHAGVPVIATDAVGAAAGGLVSDGRNGFIVPEGNAEAIAGAIERLVVDDGLAERMGEQAREDVKRFSHRAMADAFEAAIEHAIAERARAQPRA